jgi:probable phosphoglycerate mutase
VTEPGAILPDLFLVRHGETAWSLSGQHTGTSDIPLTARGEDMARDLAQVMTPIRFAHVFTSPRQRARRTCALALDGRVGEVDADLAEWDYGDYDGLTSEQVHQQVPGWNVFRDGCPGGESVAEVVVRADRLIDRLRAMTGPIALFSHGQFGCVLGARWIGLAGGAGEHLSLDPASLSVLGSRPRHPMVPVIARWNVVSADRLV